MPSLKKWHLQTVHSAYRAKPQHQSGTAQRDRQRQGRNERRRRGQTNKEKLEGMGEVGARFTSTSVPVTAPMLSHITVLRKPQKIFCTMHDETSTTRSRRRRTFTVSTPPGRDAPVPTTSTSFAGASWRPRAIGMDTLDRLDLTDLNSLLKQSTQLWSLDCLLGDLRLWAARQDSFLSLLHSRLCLCATTRVWTTLFSSAFCT